MSDESDGEIVKIINNLLIDYLTDYNGYYWFIVFKSRSNI